MIYPLNATRLLNSSVFNPIPTESKNPALLAENGAFLQIMPNARQWSISVRSLKLVRCVLRTTSFQSLVSSKEFFVVIAQI